MSLPEKNYPAICFGEILWDVLPTISLPGGAPLNVAYHLKKLGMNPALISRIGLDDHGKGLIQLLEKNNISTDFVQVDFELATGIVHATAGDNNEVVYDIIRQVAWDNIRWDDGFETLLSHAIYFVFGSLATRSKESRNTLFRLLEMTKFKVLDINLRAPYYNREITERLLQNVNLLKLNLAELELVTGWFVNYKNHTDRIKVLQNKFGISHIMVTMGSNGSVLYTGGTLYEHPGFKVEVADTIGSGDASLAALLVKLSHGSSPADALEFSSALGALIATYEGACPDYQVAEIEGLIKAGSVQKSKLIN
ncbi:MAG: carbohydrate kinase [Chitinophagaceae bacterium]